MLSNKIVKKIKREFVAVISKVFIRYVKSTYFGLEIKIPLIYGMRNGGYIIPEEIFMSDCLRSFISTKKGCVIDVGVNVGLYLVKLKAISSNINYYGVDPNPACTFYTQELIRLNSFKNAKLFTFALGESKEILSFYASRLGDGTGSLIKEHQSHNNMEYSFDTIVLTGDSLVNVLQLKEDISVIKIDVEEAELYVLRGLEQTIKKYTPYIYIEILFTATQEQNNRAMKICKFLQNINYSIIGINRDTKKLEIIKDISKVGKDYEQEYIFSPDDFVERFISSITKNNSGIEVER